MLVKKGPFEISFGKGVGHVLEDIILGAKKKLWVISPWVSPKYADILIDKSKKGVDVKLLTSNDFSNSSHKKSLAKMIDFQRELKKKPAYLSGILAFLFLALSFINIYFLAFNLVPIFVFFRYGLVSVARPKVNIILFDKKKQLTHSKIYILDNISATGSVNLTNQGMWRNIETITVIKDKEITNEIEKVFNNMENNPLLKKVLLNTIKNDLD